MSRAVRCALRIAASRRLIVVTLIIWFAFGARITGLTLTRSRLYQKNDHRFVEQKNASLVRTYFGQVRLDTAAQTAALNARYAHMWVYYNLFQPVLRLRENVHIQTCTIRRWDTAQTPFARLLATVVLS
jgi:hypothetical protein